MPELELSLTHFTNSLAAGGLRSLAEIQMKEYRNNWI